MFEFRLPDVGEGIQEGEIVKWHVKEGDAVRSDQLLAEIETDKAIVEITSPRAGTIAKISHGEGDTVKVGEILVVIAEGDEKVTSSTASHVTVLAKPSSAAEESDHYTSSVVGKLDESEVVLERKETHVTAVSSGVKATPAVRKMAKDMGVDIDKIKGTGAEGRVTENDVKGIKGNAQTVQEKTEPAPESTEPTDETVHQTKKFDFYGYIEHVPFHGIRKATAQHLSESWSKAVHVTHMDEADATELWRIHEREKDAAKAKGVHLTFMPFVIKAVIAALKDHPMLNSTLDEEHGEIIVKKYFNIGIAVDTPDGLVVPAIKEANNLSVMALATETERLAKAAVERKLDVADFKGGSFTITNVGSLGGLYATPIINYPEVAILGIGRIYDKVTVKDGKFVAIKALPFSVTFDHRVLDGAECARFANRFKSEIENPEFTLME